MSADTTQIRYKCPFCDTDKSTRKKIKRHISKSEKGDHRNLNGFKIEKTIEAYQVENDKDTNKKQMKSITKVDENKFGVQGPKIDDKIEKAADYFDKVDNNAINEIAEKAGVHKSRVMRVFKNRGVKYASKGRNPATSWADLTDNQKQILSIYYESEGNKSASSVSDDVGCSKSNAAKTIGNYSWLLIDEYRPVGDLTKQTKKEIGIKDDVDDMVNKFKETSSDDFDNEGHELLNVLSSAGVKYEIEVEIQDDDFEALKKLIKAGYDEVAEELFNN